MRTISAFSGHIYTTKASAMRAARNAVGHQYVVEAPELGSRFDGVITIGMDMIDVMAVGNGWQWNYTFDLADVLVKVRYADGTIDDVRYAEVAHWQDATTPPAESAPNPVHEVARQVQTYLRARDNAESDEERYRLYDEHVPSLIALCREAGADYGDIFRTCHTVEIALRGNTPSYIAEVIVRAAPYGLDSKNLHEHLAMWARKRGVNPSVYLEMVREAAARAAA